MVVFFSCSLTGLSPHSVSLLVAESALREVEDAARVCIGDSFASAEACGDSWRGVERAILSKQCCVVCGCCLNWSPSDYMVGFYPKGEVEGNMVWRCEPGSEWRCRASLSCRRVRSRVGARFHEYKPRIALMKCDKRLPGREDDGYSSK